MIGINLFYFIVFRFRRQNLVRTLLILTISFDIYSSGSCFKILNNEVLPGEGSHIALRNHLGIYKCFTSLSEIERKFLVFVGVLEKGDSDALYYSSAMSRIEDLY